MEAGRAVIVPLLRTYARVLGVPDVDALAILREVYDDMHANSLTVESRAFVFGTPAAGGSNVGNGAVNRLTVDADAYDIEAQHADSKTFRCIADEHSQGGANEHEELWELRGGAALRDRLEVTGSGRVLSGVKALSGRDSLRWILNPSFEDYEGSAPLTALTGWTVNTIANLTADTANTYRDYLGITTPAAMRLTGNVELEQNLNGLQVKTNPRVPIYVHVVYNRQVGSGDGTLTLTFGGVSKAVVLSAQTGWNVLKIDVDEDAWFKNWNQEDPLVKIALSGHSTGYVLVDDVTIGPYTQFDGAWYAFVGGSTPWLRDDVFTFSDTETGAILQRFFALYFGAYMPHTTGTPTWSEP